MEKRILGRTGLEVSAVGFGAMTIGGAFGPVDDNESIRALNTAVDEGINFIDTSDAYGTGHSEEVIARFIRERSDRDNILIGTKGGNNMVTGQLNFTPDYIQNCVESSLKRLGLETIDLYLLHNPAVGNIENEDSFDLLDSFVEQGKIRHWGVSVNTIPECELTLTNGRPAVMQMEYNFLEREPETVFEKAKTSDIGIIARIPFKRGFFTGRFKEGHTFVEGDIRARLLTPENMKRFKVRLDKLQEFSNEIGMSTAELALRFCISNNNLATVATGIRTAEQASQNAAFGRALPAELFERLRNL